MRPAIALAAIIVATILSFICAGNGAPSAFFVAVDRGADFLKVILALPGGPWAHDSIGFDPILQKYAASLSYKGPVGILHLMPLSMLFSLVARVTFTAISPVIIFLVLFTGFLASLIFVVRQHSQSILWCAVAIVSYPVLTILDRGNLFAGLAGLCTVAALLRQKPDWLGAVLLAIAVNVRPNLLPCIVPLALIDWRVAPRFAAVAGSILLASAFASNILYPEYTSSSFRSGYAAYSLYYVDKGLGVTLGSSLYGGLYALGDRGHAFAAMIVGASILAVGAGLRYRDRIDYADLTFICCASAAMITPVFANYHLIIFLAPLILSRDSVVFVAGILLSAPLAFGSINHFSIQTVLNPAIMLATVAWIAIRLSRSARQWSHLQTCSTPANQPKCL